MQVVAVLLSICLAVLSFYVGFQMGQSSQSTVPVPQTTVQTVPEPEPEPEPEPAPEPEAPSIMDVAVTPEPDPATLEDADEENGSVQAPDDTRFQERATQQFVVLSDNEGRQLEVEIIEIGEESLRARRQRDFRMVTIPFDLLSEEDRAFVDFLAREQATSETAFSEQSMSPEQRDLFDQIFGN